MRIILYKCNAENNRINKEDYINSAFQLEGTLKTTTSPINPVIMIEKSNPVEFGYNYMYIYEFKRYYFINDTISVKNNLWEIHAHVDVLFTWRADILSNSAILERTENLSDANLYIDDGSFVMDSHKRNMVIPYTSGFNDNGEFILICAGGSGLNAG